MIAAITSYVVGSAVLSPSFATPLPRWLEAAPLSDVSSDTPMSVPVRLVRQDGYRQIVERRVVYLTRTASGVVALDPVCTHLGCRTRYEVETGRFVCPCHGGAYDADGAVISGPPPSPLRRLQVRLDNGRVFVQL